MSTTTLPQQTLSSEEVAVLFTVRDGGSMRTSDHCIQILENEGLIVRWTEIGSDITLRRGMVRLSQTLSLTQAGRDALALYENGQ
jgi:hypothetical protein